MTNMFGKAPNLLQTQAAPTNLQSVDYGYVRIFSACLQTKAKVDFGQCS